MNSIWIVGASSGIGLALAKIYAKQPCRLYLSSRNIGRISDQLLESVAEIEYVDLDLTQSSQCHSVTEYILSQSPDLDLVAFCAGKIAFDESWKMDESVEKSVFDTNYWGPVNIGRTLIPALITRQKGHLVYLGSVSGIVSSPLRSTYGASKHALRGYVCSIRAELGQFNVTVSLVDPGFVDSGIDSRAFDGKGELRVTRDVNRLTGLDVVACAEQIIQGIDAKREEFFVGGRELAMVPLQRFFPAIVRKLLPGFRPSFESPKGQVANLLTGYTEYAIKGQGAIKLVIVNGITSSFDVWDDVLDYVDESKYQILRYNFYGRGGSTPKETTFDLGDVDKQLDELLEHVGWIPDDVHYLGYSWGCGLLSRWLLTRKVNPKSISLLGPAYWKPEKLVTLNGIRFSKIGRALFTLLGSHFLYLDYKKHCSRSFIAKGFWKKIKGYVAGKGFIKIFLSNITEDVDSWPSYIKRVNQENPGCVMAVSGSEDIKGFGGEGDEFSKTTGITEVTEIPGVNHLAPLENGLIVFKAITGFIELNESTH